MKSWFEKLEGALYGSRILIHKSFCILSFFSSGYIKSELQEMGPLLSFKAAKIILYKTKQNSNDFITIFMWQITKVEVELAC